MKYKYTLYARKGRPYLKRERVKDSTSVSSGSITEGWAKFGLGLMAGMFIMLLLGG